MLNSLRKLFSGSEPAAHARRWPRIFMSEPVRVTLPRGHQRSAMLNQISAGGARVQVSEPLHPGDVIGLDFKVGAGEHHDIDAQVVYALKEEKGFHFLCGLRFVGIAPSEVKQIGAFVEEEQNRRRIGFAMPRN